MLKKKHTELNEALICRHLHDVTENETTWILLQEPGFIGFGVVQSDEICWPPDVEPDWDRVSDLRLFGEKGEWHVWQNWGGGWQSRLLELKNIEDALTEYHVLWGSDVEPDTHPWIKLVEDRGAEIWLPLADSNLEKPDLPLRLKLKQIIDYDPKTHLAGIIDAALVGLTRESKEVIFPPSSVSSS
ncbi:hypothetical protein C6496_18710 [Candidatus Poribacteria bacterium]|nr:MAG: hypothetical protein C6496_18710 [Candidatus Poribacteria bacterium]